MKNSLQLPENYDKGENILTEIRCKKCHRLLARVEDRSIKVELVCPKCGLRQTSKN
jgi:hypothetical protein